MKVDVVILTYGEPFENSFWQQLVYSHRILKKLTLLVAPIPKLVVPFISAYRAWLRKKTWKEENYVSPLEPITERQAAGIKDALKQLAPNVEWNVHIAYEFREPQLKDVLDRVRSGRPENIALLPMYLAVSDFTNNISWTDYTGYQALSGFSLPLATTIYFRKHLDALADITADYILSKVGELGVDESKLKETGLILGCHGTVVKRPKGIMDTGYQDTYKMYRLLERRLRDRFRLVDIGWLNHTLGGEWTSPPLDKTVAKMKEQGIETVIYYPFGFIADNAETQLEGRIVMRDAGLTDYYHLPCINDDPALLEYIARRVIEKSGVVNHDKQKTRSAA